MDLPVSNSGGGQGYLGSEPTAADDDNDGTFYHAASAGEDGYVGIITTNPVQLTEVEVTGRNPELLPKPRIQWATDAEEMPSEYNADKLFDYKKNTMYRVSVEDIFRGDEQERKPLWIHWSIVDEKNSTEESTVLQSIQATAYQIVLAEWAGDEGYGAHPVEWSLIGTNTPENPDTWKEIHSFNLRDIADEEQEAYLIDGSAVWEFEIPEERQEAYTHFQINITKNGGWGEVEIADLNLIYDGCPSYDDMVVTTDIKEGSISGTTSDWNEMEGPASLFDYDTGTKWCVPMDQEHPTVIWELNNAQQITGYTISIANDTWQFPGRNPKSWTLYGLNVDATEEAGEDSWDVIDQQTDYELPFAQYAVETIEIEKTEKAYAKFRLVIDAVVAEGTMQIGDFNLMYDDAPSYAEVPTVAYYAEPWNEPEWIVTNGLNYLFDCDPGSKWENYDQFDPEEGKWVSVEWTYDAEVMPIGYELCTAHDAGDYPHRNPREWALYGWSEALVNPEEEHDGWMQLDAVSSQDEALPEEAMSYATYEIDGVEVAFSKFVLHIKLNPEGTQLAEVNLLFEGSNTMPGMDSLEGTVVYGKAAGSDKDPVVLGEYNAEEGAIVLNDKASQYTFTEFKVFNEDHPMIVAEVEFYGKANADLPVYGAEPEGGEGEEGEGEGNEGEEGGEGEDGEGNEGEDEEGGEEPKPEPKPEDSPYLKEVKGNLRAYAMIIIRRDQAQRAEEAKQAAREAVKLVPVEEEE